MLNSSGDDANYIVNADDFENVSTKISTLSRAKIIGNISNLFNGVKIDWFQKLDLSEAYGKIDISKVGHVISLKNNNCRDIMVIASSDFTGGLPDGLDAVFKESVPPIDIANWKVNVDIDSCLVTGLIWTGNIETDLNPINNIYRIKFNGTGLTGQLEKFIEKQIPLKATTEPLNFFRIDSTSNMTFHNQTLNRSSFIFRFYSDRVEAMNTSDQTTVIATYTKATSTWTYAE
jgi:hypothetical protein